MDYIYEIDEDFDKEEAYKYYEDELVSTDCNCSNCMECLGMSWRDFF